MNLSKNFTLEEFTRSSTAEKHKIKNYLPDHLKPVVIRLFEKTVQPLRDLLNVPLIISSGYRSLKLNELVGGKSNSKHTLGMAVDLMSEIPVQIMLNTLRDSNIMFTKAINENNRWLHLSFTGENSRLCYYTKDYHNYIKI